MIRDPRSVTEMDDRLFRKPFRYAGREQKAVYVLEINGNNAGYDILQMDYDTIDPPLGGNGLKGFLRRSMIKCLLRKD